MTTLKAVTTLFLIQILFRCFFIEYCNFKIVITHPDEDEVALSEKHFRGNLLIKVR